jgi:hypothetical protein
MLPTHSGPDRPRANEPPPPSVESRGSTYLSLETLADTLGGKVAFANPSLPLGVQPVTLTAGRDEWQFPNGGDRVLILPGRREVTLEHPLLFYKGKYFVPLDESASIFGYRVRKDGGLQLAVGDKVVSLKPVPVDAPEWSHKVSNLKAVHRPVVTTGSLRARRSLYKPDDNVEFAKGVPLLVRRTVAVDGVPSIVLTDCGPEFRSYLADARAVEQTTAPRALNGTAWHTARVWFDKQAVAGAALRHGDREKLARTACLTIDLCWSLRPLEPDLTAAIRTGARGRTVAPVFFLTGRWMQQHPGEVSELIQLARLPGVDVTWGLHSWDHPKYGSFLNAYPRDRIQLDDLRHERLLLEWGIVPSVYYRFPGLVHDRERLDAILDLDLFPVDCDSWMALVARQQAQDKKGPFANPVTNGSIILVHGNGNEPEGIPPFLRWLDSHPDWTSGPIHKFMPTRE